MTHVKGDFTRSALITKRFFKKAKKEGAVQIDNSVFLATGAHLIHDQKSWPDEDSRKNFRFDPAEFYFWACAEGRCEVVTRWEVGEYIRRNCKTEAAMIEYEARSKK